MTLPSWTSRSTSPAKSRPTCTWATRLHRQRSMRSVRQPAKRCCGLLRIEQPSAICSGELLDRAGGLGREDDLLGAARRPRPYQRPDHLWSLRRPGAGEDIAPNTSTPFASAMSMIRRESGSVV